MSDPSDTVHKHFKQNSGKSEFVLREGSIVGKEASPGEEEKRDEVQADLYIHHVSVHFHRWLCITCSYGRAGHTKSYTSDFEAQGQPRAVGNLAGFISASALCFRFTQAFVHIENSCGQISSRTQ